ncbi:Maternal effect embryo arrest 14-1 protein [Melia azedarach]|uniref:Maternal effect embryo arrest 14-1 protein n=1 Tax=Melia azedarach TaxID=155640 RepID=A0ACC1XY74_MELAZ|nr:Maternal effect embryo arrest 14-1 protein [Melia azedarach]
MLKSIGVGSSSVPLLVEAKDIHGAKTCVSETSRFASVVCCSSRTNGSDVPKLEPFSRSKFERAVRELPLIDKAENDLSEYCSTLEGDDSYSCWRSYFELKDLERVSPKEDVEKLILQTGGVKSLIGCIHGISSIHNRKGKGFALAKPFGAEREGSKPCPIPDGLPKTLEELEEEEKGRMPDSPYTRLLRTKGRFPAWYSPAPDHETD